MQQRIQKILSHYGVASRRQSEQMILDGRVRINGNTARLGDTAEEDDVIEVDGVRLRKAPPRVYIMLYKPRGFVTTLSDEQGRKNVSELVTDCGERVYPVGRLDLNSEGLLIMTNDGTLAQSLTHPKGEIQKVYLVWVRGYQNEALRLLQSPIEIDGRNTKPAKIRVIKESDASTLLEFTISEGRNRQIRRICERAGLTVTRLCRIKEGTLSLGNLRPGQWRHLTEQELQLLRNEK